MNLKSVFSSSIVLSVVFIQSAIAYSDGPPDGRAGNPPARATCVECHNSFALNSGNGGLNLLNLPAEYAPGETYRITASLQDPGARRWGFQLTSIGENNQRAGMLDAVNRNQVQVSSIPGRPEYAKHTANGNFPNQQQGAQWEIDWTAPDDDIGNVSFYMAGNAANFNRNPSGDRIYAGSWSINAAEPPPPPDEFTIALAPGWNFASSPVTPGAPALETLFAASIETGALTMIRDGLGRVFDPAGEVNDIGDWTPFQAYQIKMTEEADVTFIGANIDPETPILLEPGWNWIAYTRLDTLHPAEAFVEIDESLLLVKDRRDRFYHPQRGFNGLGMIYPGSGMMINVRDEIDSALSLVWPHPSGLLEPPAERAGAQHFEVEFTNTGRSMSVLVVDFGDGFEPEIGDEIAVYADNEEVGNLLVGAAVVGEDPRTPVIVWGDDDTTPETVEGASMGDTLSFGYWDAGEEDLHHYHWIALGGGELIFTPDGFLALRFIEPFSAPEDASMPPETIAVAGIYPNPFNNEAQLGFVLKAGGAVSVSIIDGNGRLVESWGGKFYPAGVHSVQFNGSGLPAGVYTVVVEYGGIENRRRAVLVK